MVAKTITLALTEYNSILEDNVITKKKLEEAQAENVKLNAQIPTLARVYVPSNHNPYREYSQLVMIEYNKKEQFYNLLAPYIKKNEEWLEAGRTKLKLEQELRDAKGRNKAELQIIKDAQKELDKYPNWFLRIIKYLK